MSNKYLFWIDDPTVLYKSGKYTEIIPTNNMTRVEQLNAMTRFFIYLLMALLLFDKLDSWIYLPIIGIIFIVILYNIYQYNPKNKFKKSVNKKLDFGENFDQKNQIKDLDKKNNHKTDLKYYDSDSNLHLGKEYSVHDKNNDNLLHTPDEIVDYQETTYRHPTIDNPFMNPTIMDFNTVDPPIACNSDDEDIKDEIDNNFNNALYMDQDDIFNIKNSQRMWYTVPMPAIPPDTIALANWLSKSDTTCKEDQEMCPYYTNLKFER